MKGKFGLTVAGIAVVSVLSTVALTDKHESVPPMPIGIIQYNGVDTFKYQTMEDASVITNIAVEELDSAIENQVILDGYFFKEIYK